MGCAEILALLSDVSEYNEVLDAGFLMAPPAFMGRSRASYVTGLASLFESFMGYKELRRYRNSRQVYFPDFMERDMAFLC